MKIKATLSASKIVEVPDNISEDDFEEVSASIEADLYSELEMEFMRFSDDKGAN